MNPTMNIHIVTASAGTGKTTRLANILSEAIHNNEARPECIVATTFTKQAAAELQNRARKRLLSSGQAKEAQSILAARIGTVNAVCGSFVTDFAFELGLSPELRILDEDAAAIELRRALATVVSENESDQLGQYKDKFDQDFDWQFEVQRLIEASRANGLDAQAVAACAEQSVTSLDECLGPTEKSGTALDAALTDAIKRALSDIATLNDATKVTAKYVDFLKDAHRDLENGCLRWGDWAKLSKETGAKKTSDVSESVQKVALRHSRHPRLRADMHQMIRQIFDVAQRGIIAFQAHKLALGVMDYVDQEVLALQLLSRDDISEALRGQLDLVLVDEFQDTSPLQLSIFLKLARLAKRSVWVGDPKQAIFGFRGTDPALMDAAINSLSNPTRDPDLIDAAVQAVTQKVPVETLSTSYRSRPELVDVTNAVFAAAFSKSQDMPVERVQLKAARESNSELGPAISFWPLLNTKNQATDAAALADGVRTLLNEAPQIWDRSSNTARPCTARDVALLCRTNAQCAAVAESLGALGIDALVARTGLLRTAEAQVLLAGLALWIDERDRLAAATLTRVLDFPEDANAFLDLVLKKDQEDRPCSIPLPQKLTQRKKDNPDRDVPEIIDLLIAALDLRELCAAWGQSAQRTANLDEFRAHAVRYCNKQRMSRDAPSPVGFLSYLGELVATDRFSTLTSDTCARVGGEDAVTVSTWHGAKGLEWPVVVLFGLESVRDPVAYGVHVMADRKVFDVDDPLGGRRVHFWPNPYTTSRQGGPVKDAYESSEAHAQVVSRATREALRVLYVGWTRPRDRLVLAVRAGKFLDGILNTLVDIDAQIIHDPNSTEPGALNVQWGTQEFSLAVNPSAPAMDSSPKPTLPGNIRVSPPAKQYPPARVSPAKAPARAFTLGTQISLGAPVKNSGADATELGSTVHAFLAADHREDPVTARTEMARLLLERWGTTQGLSPQALVAIADRFWDWVRENYPDATVRREWPVALRQPSGTIIQGTADLIIETAKTVVIVDHKSYATASAVARSEALGGQLAAYAAAVSKAKPGHAIETWVHLPLGGLVAEVKLA